MIKPLLGMLAIAAIAVTPAAAQELPIAPEPSAVVPQYSSDLRVGDRAPAFSLPGSDGQTHALADYKGRMVALAWFPKAFSGQCTAECRSIAAREAILKQYDVAILMASVDDAETNARFAKEQGMTFPILSDPGKKVARAYGVVRLDVPQVRQVAERWTFYIGPDGRIIGIDRNPQTTAAGDVMARRLQALGAKKR